MELIVTTIDSRTWLIEEKVAHYSVYCYLIEGNDKAMVLDTGLGLCDLRPTLEKLTNKPMEVVLTHGHIDHIGCNAQFDKIHIHKADRDSLALNGSAEFKTQTLAGFGLLDILPLEQRALYCTTLDTSKYNLFEDGQTFDLGGRVLTAITVAGHTPGSVCLYDPTGYLFSGDSVCDQGVLLNLPFSCTVTDYLASMKHLQECCPSDVVIYPCHHKVPIDVSWITRYIQCAEKIISGEVVGVESPSLTGDAGLMAVHDGIALAYFRDKI